MAGSIVRRTRWGRAQRVRAYKQWCDEDEEIFLDCLAATCNVVMACEQADVSGSTVYRQRRKRADFAMKWQAALEQGYARLEMGMLESANRAFTGDEGFGDAVVAPMSAELALKLLQFHRASVTGQGRASGWRGPPKRLEDLRESILRKIEAIECAGDED